MRTKFLLSWRPRVRHNNRKFVATKQISEPAGFRIKSFYGAINIQIPKIAFL